MNVGEFFAGFFGHVFRIFEIRLPFFNLPIWYVLVGMFVVNLSVAIYRYYVRDNFEYHPYHSYVGGKEYKRKGE